MTEIKNRKEFFFAYDIKMGNPNGDPDENRPRVLPDGTYYVTDVRLKRFVRDFLKSQGSDILVDTIEEKTTNLTGRVVDYLQKSDKKNANGAELVNILLDAFIDARLFGSSFAFKEQGGIKLEPTPKTLTGATQINMGEVLHESETVDIYGTTTFGSDDTKSQGTFTEYYGLRYALIGFNGITNEHSAKISKMSEEDYKLLLEALWKSVRSSANTRTKVGQVPRLLISIEYQPDSEFQFGNLIDYIKPAIIASTNKDSKKWESPQDYKIDLLKLKERFNEFKNKISSISYCVSPDIKFIDNGGIDKDWIDLNLDGKQTDK